jgi:hypothetical protein
MGNCLLTESDRQIFALNSPFTIVMAKNEKPEILVNALQSSSLSSSTPFDVNHATTPSK